MPGYIRKMRIDILTLFPQLFEAPFSFGIFKRAIDNGLVSLNLINIRDYTHDKHHTADDYPYGGGAGMVMKCEPIVAAIDSLRGRNSLEHVILLSPRGRRLDQRIVKDLAQAPDLVLICARYEGVDERVRLSVSTDEISIGDYVLSGGELPALVIVEAISRMLPGVVGNWESVLTDSFYDGILGAPQYTRPPSFRGMDVPEVLMSGNHAAIARWRRKEALRTTRERRPDLLTACTDEDRILLAEIEREEAQRRKENEP